MRFSVLLAASFLFAGNVNAQDSPRVHADGIDILLLADNPFSARYSVDSTQKQDDGSLKTVHVDTNVARDRQGRVYREHRSPAPSNSGSESAITDIFILDPVAHTRTTCNLGARHCLVARYDGPSYLKPAPDGLLDPSAHFVTSKSLGNDLTKASKSPARAKRSKFAEVGRRKNGSAARESFGIPPTLA